MENVGGIFVPNNLLECLGKISNLYSEYKRARKLVLRLRRIAHNGQGEPTQSHLEHLDLAERLVKTITEDIVQELAALRHYDHEIEQLILATFPPPVNR